MQLSFNKIYPGRNDPEEPYFAVLDVCNALGYEKARNAVMQHVDTDDALKQGLTDSLGRTQETTPKIRPELALWGTHSEIARMTTPVYV